MIRDINGLGSLNEARNRPGSSAGKSSGSEASAGNTGAAVDSNSDGVALSDQAQSLQIIEEKIRNLPEVNQAKVDSIKTALADGSFKIDNLILADKLLNSDALLGE
jgi:negative regulator of flagellin synthesis FlgM